MIVCYIAQYLIVDNTESLGKCANCGEPLQGKHCHVCGEKKINPEELTFKHFFNQSFEIITHYDSRVLRSVYHVFRKPGFLVTENLEGRRVRYAKPIQLFFLINIIYFFVLSFIEIGFDAVTNRATDHMENFFYGGYASSLVNEKVTEKNIPLEEYDEKFYNEIYVESKLLIIFMIPLYALWLKLIYLKKNILYYEHLIFATYFFCFILLFYTLVLNVVVYPLIYNTQFLHGGAELIDYNSGELMAELTVLIFAAVYLFFAIKQVHKQSAGQTLFKTFLAVIGLVLTFNVFKFLIFLTAFYTT